MTAVTLTAHLGGQSSAFDLSYLRFAKANLMCCRRGTFHTAQKLITFSFTFYIFLSHKKKTVKARMLRYFKYL